MKVRKYQDDEGELHYIHEIHVDKINFLHRKTKLASGETALETVSNDDAVQDITQ
jgi:single-stranded DNA-binding protein